MHAPQPETTGQAASPSTPPPTPVERPKSAYELPSKKNTVLRNMIWALLLTVGAVAIVGIAFFGVGSDLDRSVPENSQLDLGESAQRAAEVAPFPVAVPAAGEDWQERSARFADGAQPTWEIRYSSPQGELVTLTEGSEISASMLSSALPGSTVEEELTIAGAQCELLRGAAQDGDAGASAARGISCAGEDWGLLVHGDADRAELEQLMESAIASLD